MKFITVADGPCEFAVVFSTWLKHREVAAALPARLTIVSAGFCRIFGDPTSGAPEDVRVDVWGHSESIGLPSRPERDAKLILRELRRPEA